MAAWAAGLAAMPLAGPAAAAVDTLPARVAGHVYHLPRILLNRFNAGSDHLEQAFNLQVTWPGLGRPPPGATNYLEYDVVGVTVQDVSGSTRVEHLATVPGGERARFLTLWRDSTVDQMALSPGFDLGRTDLRDTPAAARFGLHELVPRDAAMVPADRHVFADDGPAALSLIMTCQDAVSCQLWWRQDGAAVELTFGMQLLPQWEAMRARAGGMLRQMQADEAVAP